MLTHLASAINPVDPNTLFNTDYIPLPGPPVENPEASPSMTCKTVDVAKNFKFYPELLNPNNMVVD